MPKVKTLNKISSKGLALFGKNYEVGDQVESPEAILVRSTKVDTDSFEGLLAVARAGAGVNNITIDKASAKGVCVFNTPGANANAVAELVFTALGMAARNVHKGLAWTETLKGKTDKEIEEAVEKNKSMFAGFELAGKTMGVIGLGKIGVLAANGAIGRGMKVLAYEPYPSIWNMLKLDSTVTVTANLDDVIAGSDFLTVHVPFMPATKDLLNAGNLANFQGSYIMNFARNGIVNSEAVIDLLDSGKLQGYVTDFPNGIKLDHEKVLCLPHLGASTEEAEENCATMAVDQLKDYLEYGIVRNSVNFPAVDGRPGAHIKSRIVVINQDVPNMIAEISKVFGTAHINIASFKNESNGKIGYNLIDLDSAISSDVVTALAKLDKVIKVRVITF